MIAEVLLVLAGHSSSLFAPDGSLNPAFKPLLHPGEQHTLEALAHIAARYRAITTACAALSRRPSRYVCALAATLTHILKDEYEVLVVETEARVLRRDPELVAGAAFVPLSAVRAVFAEWDAPFAALSVLMEDVQREPAWRPGPLIDLLVARAKTGVHRVADILARISVAVQRVWRTQLAAYLVHGSLAAVDPLADANFALTKGAVPACVSAQSAESIAYIGRAIATVKAVRWQKQLPRDLANQHTALLEGVLPHDRHAFDRVILQIRTNVGEWLWENVLTKKDVDDAVDSLANYFLIRNGEFSLSLIREIERLKLTRLTARSSMIREQDLNLALLRASLGTTAQHDPYLSRLRFVLPGGPLFPTLSNDIPGMFDTVLLGTPLLLTYNLSWPLDLFLDRADLTIYSSLFAFLSALRKTHTNVHTCWTALSNAQRARRRWTGLSEGDDARAQMLRCGWGVVRDMGWFLDTLLGYVMMDVIDSEFRTLQAQLATPRTTLDFSTLRTMHASYLGRLLDGCLLTDPSLSGSLRQILEVCARFVGLVERWGGDVLPALLGEGSLADDGGQSLLKERWAAVASINESLRGLLEGFYEGLTQSMTQQPFVTAGDASKSALMGTSMVNQTAASANLTRTRMLDKDGEQSRRHVERLLLRLDFNGGLSRPRKKETDILAEGGL